MEKKATLAVLFEVFMMYRVICQGVGSIFCNKLVNFAPRESFFCITVLKLET